MSRPCFECGSDFEPNFAEQKYCSRSCNMRRLNRDREHQSVAGVAGGRRPRPTPKPSTYLKAPGTDSHEHRVVAERELGRPLLPGEVVHHEDRNKHNNAPTNLVVFPSQAVHARHHKLNHWGPCECPCVRLGGDAK